MEKDFTLLYQKYKDPIFSYIYYLSNNHTEAEEICQDVFLKVYLNIDKFEGRSSFKTWIYRIAKNTFLDFKRRNAKEVLTCEVGIFEGRDYNGGEHPEEYLEKVQHQRLIKDTLLRMRENYRVYIILRDIQGLNYQEIAEIMDTGLNTVKVSIYRARNEFQKIYKELEVK